MIFFKEKAEHMVNTSAIANSIFTYFISYKFYCGKGKKKEEITSIYLK